MTKLFPFRENYSSLSSYDTLSYNLTVLLLLQKVALFLYTCLIIPKTLTSKEEIVLNYFFSIINKLCKKADLISEIKGSLRSIELNSPLLMC